MPRAPRTGGPRATAPRTFATQAAFRAWLERHHASEGELSIRLFRVHEASRGLTYKQALDEALCFGWIDGVRHGFDDASFIVRFTPRQPRSIWSRVNLRRVAELEAEGRMAPAGRATLAARDPARTGLYSFERAAMTLTPVYARKLRAAKAAWTFFKGQPPWYRRTTTFWVMSAKRETTREKRLDVLITYSLRGRTIPLLTRTRGKK